MAECSLEDPKKIIKNFTIPDVFPANLVNIRNCLSGYIDLGECNSVAEEMSVPFTTYTYTVVDAETLQEGEPISSKAYQFRLYGIAISCNVSKMNKLQKRESNLSNITFYNERLMLSGNYSCKLYGVDTKNRLVLDLINPVTGESASARMLSTYPKTFRQYREIV